MQQISRRQFVGWGLSSAGVLNLTGCGTVLHPERRGQPAGPLDWGVVALDAVGLLLFFVPGVIAFAVDFATGAIYLPPNGYSRRDTDNEPPQLVHVETLDKRLTVRVLEDCVSTHAQREIRLAPGSYRTQEMGDINEFWTAVERLGRAPERIIS